MCTQDSAGYPSRVHLIISRLETERGVGFEPRKRDTRPVAALKTIRELQHDLMQKINKYEPIYFGAYPTNNSVDIRSSSESESNSDSDCEQEARPATGKWAFSKCDIVSDLVVRVALDYLKSLGRHLRRRIPPVTLQNLAVVTVTASVSLPRMVTNLVIYPSCRLVFGTLYPAYASYKAVRTKNVKEYVKWMMYWIVFALFTCAETVTDVFFSWFPFYYEVKILLVLWLLSPATKGSSILYRKFVHPALCRREQEIDEYISKAKDQGYHTVLNLGTKGVNYATNVIMQTAIKNFGVQSRPYAIPSPRQPIASVRNRRDPTPDVTYVDHYANDQVDTVFEISDEAEFVPLIPKMERDEMATLIYREEDLEIEETPSTRSGRAKTTKKKTGVAKRPRSTSRKTRKQTADKAKAKSNSTNIISVE